MGSIECDFRVLDVAVIGGGIGMFAPQSISELLSSCQSQVDFAQQPPSDKPDTKSLSTSEQTTQEK
jgi:hypothetical protein